MKYLDEYRDPAAIKHFVHAIKQVTTRPWTIMEICGGQTHSIVRYGLQQLLPPEIELIHGPGCPVCVTPQAKIDLAIALAERPGFIVCSYGDMLRVPGSSRSLLDAKTAGADVRVVHSPMDALALAEQLPGKEVIFFAVGFETTAPVNVLPARIAHERGIKNFSLLVSHVLVPPAIRAIMQQPGHTIQGFLAAGHVCTIMGVHEYESLAADLRIPIVVTGFEPVDILEGLYLCIQSLERGTHEVTNQYARSVTASGNTAAQAMLETMFEIVDMEWRGIGSIPKSGYALKPAWAAYDAERKFGSLSVPHRDTNNCQAGRILQGLMKPHQCPYFGNTCTPERPLGAPMVSTEGACAAYFQYQRYQVAPSQQPTSQVVLRGASS